ncbi:MAG TPA: HAD family hydrolase [Sphingomonadaceae bacterium]|nr:HAD family hydrolase [Sphingomonadaceae bacterium]
MVSKRAVLFDVDGTLIDSNDFHAEAWQRTFAEWGHEVPFERIRSQIGKGGDNLLPALLPADFVKANKEAMESFRTDLFAREYMDRIKPFPQVRALFERVGEAGFDIVLASSGKEEEVAHHLKLIGSEDLVVSTTSADDAEHSKPDPDIFRSALAKLDGVAAGDAVVVGDSPYDMLAAAALGVPTIGFRSGGFPDPVLMEAGCREIFDGPADLLARFDASLLAKEPIDA